MKFGLRTGIAVSVLTGLWIISGSADAQPTAKPASAAATSPNPSLQKEKLEFKLWKAVMAEREDEIRSLLREGTDINAALPEGQTGLTLAIVNGASPLIIKLLLQEGANPNLPNQQGWTPLRQAIEGGSGDKPPVPVEVIRLLLEHNANPQWSLCAAIQRNRLDLVALLLQHGARINLTNQEGLSPLCCAAQSGLDDICSLLLDHGAELNLAPSKSGINNPLCAAIRAGKHSAAMILLNRGADPKLATWEGRHPIWGAVQRSEMAPVVQRLIDMDAVQDWKMKDERGCSLLHYLARNNSLPLVRSALEKGADINAKDEKGETPLFWVLNSGLAHEGDCSEMIKLLLDHGASVNTVAGDNGGMTPLMAAFHIKNATQIIPLMLDRGAELNIKDIGGHTAFYWAACISRRLDLANLLLERGLQPTRNDVLSDALFRAEDPKDQQEQLKILTRLLDRGVDVNAQHEGNNNGQSMLMMAAIHLRPDMVELLLKRGANPNNADDQGQTALIYICQCTTHPEALTNAEKIKQIITFLLAAGAKPTGADFSGATPLHYAAQGLNTDFVQLLLDRGAKINATDHTGRTPLDLSVGKTIKFLTDKGGFKGTDLPK